MNTMGRVLLTLVVGTVPAWATLGQYEGSVSTDQQRMRTEDRVQDFRSYKVHQLTANNGTIVREYVSPKGMVFGVAWQGRFMPDMNQLLGNYVTNLQTASKAQTQIHQRRSLIVKTGNFVFVSSGHMRLFSGSAYVPSLIPNNVSMEVVK